jgi:hypothetical protein
VSDSSTAPQAAAEMRKTSTMSIVVGVSPRRACGGVAPREALWSAADFPCAERKDHQIEVGQTVIDVVFPWSWRRDDNRPALYALV